MYCAVLVFNFSVKLASMSYISVNTSQNVSIAYDVSGIGERILARIIDFALFIILFLFFLLIINYLGLSSGIDWFLPAYFITMLALFVFYDLLCECFFNGQSVGKYVMKIRVISLDGYQPTIGQYLLRWVFRFVDFMLTMQVGGLLAVAVTPNKQRIGDIVAGTTVIRTVPRAKLADVAFVQSHAEDYEPRFPEVAELRDMDIDLIHEVVDNFNRSGNHLLIYQMSVKIQEVLPLQKPSEMDDLQFLKQVVRDYSYVTSRE